jgi:hypothetical protein
MATSTTAPSAAALPARKPMARATRVSLFEREIRVHLATPAIDLMFRGAQLLSEGQWQGERWFGSTMITLDLARLADQVRDACDAATAHRVAELLARDVRVAARARAGRPLLRVDVELSARAAGECVHIDLDVEGA